MFSLIITIISIALVTALALATIYYGGSAFREGADAAAAARLINEGQQLAGATAIYENSGSFPVGDAVTQDQLFTAKALASKIASFGDAAARSFSTPGTVTDKVCGKVNEKANLGSTKVANVAAVTGIYGCYGTAVDANTVVFKF